jgi:hypothetical protein
MSLAGQTFGGRTRQYIKKGKNKLLSSKPGWRAVEDFQRENCAHAAITETSDNLLARGFRLLAKLKKGKNTCLPIPAIHLW